MFDVTIIGCGVIGAVLARKLSQYDLRILILERENDVAMGTTKANSAIVHAGYDPEPGTLMAKLNVQGSEPDGETLPGTGCGIPPLRFHGAGILCGGDRHVENTV